MTTDEIVLKFKQICEIKKQIKALQIQRTENEKAIGIQYKVDECNRLRNESALNYQKQINDLVAQLYLIEDELGG